MNKNIGKATMHFGFDIAEKDEDKTVFIGLGKIIVHHRKKSGDSGNDYTGSDIRSDIKSS